MEPLKTRLFKPRYLTLLALFAVSVAYVYWPERTHPEQRQQLLASIPVTLGEWKMTREHTIPPRQLATLGAAEYVLRTYRRGNDEVLLYIAFFTGKHGSLTHNPEKCYPATGYTVTRKETVHSRVPGRDSFDAIRIVPVRDQEKMVVLYWLQEGSEVIISKRKHIWKVLTKAILYNRTDSLMVRLSTDYTTEEDIEKRSAVLEDLGNRVRIEIARALENRDMNTRRNPDV